MGKDFAINNMLQIDLSIEPKELVALIHLQCSHRVFSQLPLWQQNIWNFLAEWIEEKNQYFEIKTSGSTGTPKTILHSRKSMLASATATCTFFELKGNDTALLALPVTHIGGRMMLVRSLQAKLKLICVEPKANPLLLLSENTLIDFAAFTPMQLHHILSEKSTATLIQNFKTIIIGGGEISNSLLTLLAPLSGAVYETYGMTETVSHIALKRVNGENRTHFFTCLYGIEVTSDARNCLIINAPNLSDTPLITNDIVHLKDATHFEWMGRFDNIINTGGIKIQAEEVERKIKQLFQKRFFISSKKDTILGEKLILALENDSLLPNEIEEILQQITPHLSKYEKPKEILTTPKFIETSNGKINRKETVALLF